MSNLQQGRASGFWRKAKTIKDAALGRITYQKIADANASELNALLSQKTIKTPDQALSVYEFFNEGNAAPRFEDSMGALNGIDVYRVTYKTRSPDTGKRYKVSGLLSVPTSADQTPTNNSLPLVSWQHGTILYPQDAPSNLFKQDAINLDPYGVPYSAETLFNLVKLGGNGFAIAASDYIGNDGSKNTQAYAIKETTVQTTQDMIHASRAILNSLGITSEDVFMNGWSQGGLNTQWLADALQAKGDPVERIAVASGPSDLYETLKYWFNDYPGTPPWLSSLVPLLIGAYQKYYNMDGLMRKSIQPKYLKIAKQIYNKTFDWSQGLPDLPVDPKQMLTDEIIGQINSGTGIFADKIISNTALQAKYSAPSIFFGGENDTVVPPLNSITIPVDYQASLGSIVASGENMGTAATHRSTFLSSLFNTNQSNVLDFFTSSSL
jgi:pimeloyl-ACP methyl ester carboxylesterase